MAKTPLKQISRIVNDDAEQNGVIQTSKIDVPHTTIVNRAQIIDLANDLSVNFGINRIQTQQISRIQDESGANGELVYKIPNDKFDQIRYVGEWDNTNGTNGQYNSVATAADTVSYVEITFYGTGLNLLRHYDSNDANYVASVDGGAEGGNLYDPNLTSVINVRNYSMNSVVNVASGLALGIHTVKIRNNGGATNSLITMGFEILNETATLEVNAGHTYIDGLRVNHAAESISYNSDFTNVSGTAGTKGGAVIAYMNSLGEIKKDIQYTDVTATNLVSGGVDHSNEEVVRSYSWREFGAGRADDFSTTPPTSGDDAFTLDDGTTTLVGNNTASFVDLDIDGFFHFGVGAFSHFTFVGTGLDVFCFRSLATTCEYTVWIDGIEVTSGMTPSSTLFPQAQSGSGIAKICSGLPYGTHTVSFVRGSGATGPTFKDFIVYGPKKPELPENAVALSSYYLMADYDKVFVHPTERSNSSIQGLIFKANMREMTYEGTWGNIGFDSPEYRSGYRVNQLSVGSKVSYSFHGTGVLFTLGSTGTGNRSFKIYIDDVLYDGASFIMGLGSNDGAGVYSTTSGSLQTDVVEIVGLPLGAHKITVEDNSSTGLLYFEGFDIITPVHSPKNNGPFVVGNTLSVGSTAMSDDRIFSESTIQIDKKAMITSLALDYGPFTAATFPGAPIGALGSIYLEKRSKVQVSMNVQKSAAGGGATGQAVLMVDGEHQIEFTPAERDTPESMMSVSGVIELEKGYHSLQIFFRTLSGSASLFGNNRTNLSIVIID